MFQVELLGAACGIYFFVTFVGGLELLWDILNIRKTPPTPFMRLIGMTMLLDSMAIIVSSISMTIGYRTFLASLSQICDISVGGMMILSGLSIISRGWPSWKAMVSVVSPIAAAVILLSAFKVPGFYSGLVCTGLFCIVSIAIGIKILRYERRLKDNFSNVENRQVGWYIPVLAALVLEGPFYFYTCFVNPQDWSYTAYDLLMASIYFYLLVKTAKQEEGAKLSISDEGEEPDGLATASTEDSQPHLRISEDQIQLYREKLNVLMEQEKVFMNPDLSVDDLVKEIGTNSAYFYYFMRDVMQTKFYDYVNGYRVEAAKQQLEQTDLKINIVAENCGFKSSQAFARTFKRHTDMLPSEWRLKTQIQ